MHNNDRVAEIRRRLSIALKPVELEVIDESHNHIGHAGARDGRGHFKVIVRANSLAGMTSLQRHRKIYEILGDLMQTDIHAVSLDATAPNEIADKYSSGTRNELL